MPINTDLNVSPFFDDYKANSEYYRILFRPSVPVQARELTQIQSMMQNQIEQFAGNFAYKSGDIVKDCSIKDIPIMPYLRLADFQTNGASFDIFSLVNTQIISASSNLAARVVIANTGLASNYPNTNIVYVTYGSVGDAVGANGELIFSNNDTFTFRKLPLTGNDSIDIVAVINAYSNSTANTYTTGNAHAVTVSSGVVYLNGEFVTINSPITGLVNNFGIYAGNNVVGFELVENIVTENQDQSLLDNALGYPNENAPGAWRLKLNASIASYAPENTPNNFVSFANYNFGKYVAKQPVIDVHATVGNAISQSLYETSGNYVINPFTLDSVTNTGDPNRAPSSANNILGRISTGVGYAQGNRVEFFATQYINMRRGVDTAVKKQQQISFTYGGYYVLNEVAGGFAFSNAATVNLYDASQKAVTSYSFSSLSPAGNLIGTASVRSFIQATGVPGTNTAQYYLHVFNIKMNTGYNTSQIKSVYYNGSYKGVGDVVSNGLVGTNTKDQLFSFGSKGLKNLKDSANNNNTEYTYRTNKTGTMSTSGVVVVNPIATSQPGGTDILPFGSGITLTDTEAATIDLIITANVDSSSLTGTVTTYTTNTLVVGSSTSFTTKFAIGDQIKVQNSSANAVRTVVGITDDTHLNVDAAFGDGSSGKTFYKAYIAGKILPLVQNPLYGPSANVTIASGNTSSFTINSGQFPSATVAVDVVYNVLRTQTSPAKKEIKKRRLVKIDTTTNAGGIKGPWSLGFSDIHQIRAVYGCNTGSYAISGDGIADITSSFVFDTGQKDTHYDLGKLYINGSYDSTTYPKLLVELDYFAPNTSTGCGFFTVESYNIDDANTANTTAILTKDIPLYVDEKGNKLWLRDYVDFRTPANNTANNTGDIGVYYDSVSQSWLANTTNLTTAITYATENPSSTLSFLVPTGGLNVPAYGQNFQSDYTIYLGRRDLVYVSPDNNGTLHVKEGVSSETPQQPLFPDNAMALSVFNIPPYPSLSTDQIDDDQTTNRTSINLIRDTSTAITTSLVTNRRYTMQDIGKLDNRISNLEYYTQLSLLQQKANGLTITDSNGLNRFKNGIFVESFNDFQKSEVSNPEYKFAIDFANAKGRPRFFNETIDLVYNGGISANVQQTGHFITLPYVERNFITQPYATKYRSPAHLAKAWNGHIDLYPSYSADVDTKNTASLNITNDNAKPWQDFAQTPFATSYGAPRTTTSTTSNTVTTGTVDTNVVTKTQDVYVGDATIVTKTQDLYIGVSSGTTVQSVKDQMNNFINGSVGLPAQYYYGGLPNSGFGPGAIVGNITINDQVVNNWAGSDS
jgi:hypothetical protein